MNPTVKGIVQTDGRKRNVSVIIAEDGRGARACRAGPSNFLHGPEVERFHEIAGGKSSGRGAGLSC